jgi:hypothetical protein
MMQQAGPSLDTRVATWLGLIRSEYRESPGLCLTLPQARRFWALDETESRTLFTALVDAGFLKRTKAGAYVRTS